MMRTVFAIIMIVSAASAVGLSAESTRADTVQPEKKATAPRPAPTPLLTVLSASPAKQTDSPLVRLAKKNREAAARNPPVAVIDDAAVKASGGTLTESNYVPDPSSVLARPPEPSARPTPAPSPSRAEERKKELQRRLDTLLRSQEAMAAESDEVYPNAIEDDDIDRRMAEIQKAIEETKKEMANPPR